MPNNAQKVTPNNSQSDTNSREKYTAKPVQFGGPPPPFGSFDQRFRLIYYLKSLRGTIRKVQSFSF
jgi:hypothetical protein